jgi:glycosyltransferase involved in cell wall biosynthesis
MDRKQLETLFEVKNITQLQDRIQTLLDDEDLRKLLGSNARRNVELHFEGKQVIIAYIDYINCLLST